MNEENRYTTPMGIFERIGDVIRSYLSDDSEKSFREDNRRSGRGDPDLEAAYEELDEFLGKKERAAFTDNPGKAEGAAGAKREKQASAEQEKKAPESLRKDFAELGLPLGASAEECKIAYKKLLKIHHPDRHAGHPENLRKATAKSARLNVSFDRIEKWRETGRID